MWACSVQSVASVLGKSRKLLLRSTVTDCRAVDYSGTQDTALSDTANAVLYGVFAIMGIFAGSINVSPITGSGIYSICLT